MPLFTTGDGSDETVLFVTLQIVAPLWFRRSLIQAIVLMTQPGNWAEYGDANIQFATDKATEMLNSMVFSEEQPTLIYPPEALMFHAQSVVDVGNAIAMTVDIAQIFNHFYRQDTAALADEFHQEFLLAAGTYTFEVCYKRNTVSGIIRWYLDGTPILLSDLYHGTAQNNYIETSPDIDVSESGLHTLSAQVISKNASSTNYNASITHFLFRKQ